MLRKLMFKGQGLGLRFHNPVSLSPYNGGFVRQDIYISKK
jgi:hypothetical protein